VEATGALEVSASNMTYVNASMTAEERDKMYGNLISENTVGIFHDHFFNFHLDLDVDGVNNSFVEGKLVRHLIPPEESLRKSRWGMERHTAKTEEEGRVNLNGQLNNPSNFYVTNPTKKTRLGNAVSYRVVPGAVAASLLDPADFPQIRAGFVENQVRCHFST
jgi:primary-amine oxidase